MVALINAVIPLWVVLIDWLLYRSTRPGLVLFIGLVLGLVGMLLLIEPDHLMAGTGLYPPAVMLLLIASLSWAYGSLLSRRKLANVPPRITTAMQLLAGGLLLLPAAFLSGESLVVESVSLRSLGALAWLIVGSSIIAFGSYIWLMKVDSPARASTYAFVNPVIALGLGVALANEPFTLRTLLAAVIILTGVVIVIYQRQISTHFRPILVAMLHHILR
jgi:drug/metabolite transporter (DMT)-like permease